MRALGQPTLIPGPGVQLRPWAPSDAEALIEAFQDPEIRRWHLRELTSPEEAQVWIASWSDRWEAETDGSWAIVDSGSGVVRGQTGLRSITLEFGIAHISYWIRPAFRGAGTASSAADAVARWALEDLGLHRLEIHHSTQNEVSCRVAERAGFEFEGVLRSALFHENGWHDMHVHARLSDPG
jgi:ribosomal-protein-alanine N-acetyltransferase